MSWFAATAQPMRASLRDRCIVVAGAALILAVAGCTEKDGGGDSPTRQVLVVSRLTVAPIATLQVIDDGSYFVNDSTNRLTRRGVMSRGEFQALTQHLSPEILRALFEESEADSSRCSRVVGSYVISARVASADAIGSVAARTAIDYFVSILEQAER